MGVPVCLTAGGPPKRAGRARTGSHRPLIGVGTRVGGRSRPRAFGRDHAQSTAGRQGSTIRSWSISGCFWELARPSPERGFGRCGALLPLFRLVGVPCIAALWRVKSLPRHRSDRPNCVFVGQNADRDRSVPRRSGTASSSGQAPDRRDWSICLSQAIPRDMFQVLPTGFVPPCLPTFAPAAPEGPQWAHEIKHDGFRFICRRDGDRVRVYTATAAT